MLFAELLKLFFCTLTILYLESGPLGMYERLKEDIWDRKSDTLKVAVPALCYTVQNNLQFVAASHLGAALLQLLYQTKTLSTAIFGVVILSKSLRCNQWLALMVLVAGVVTAQWSPQGGSGELAKGDVMTGVLAALGVSICSGFASVYLEKILKGALSRRLECDCVAEILSVPGARRLIALTPAPSPQATRPRYGCETSSSASSPFRCSCSPCGSAIGPPCSRKDGCTASARSHGWSCACLPLAGSWWPL